MFGSVKGLGLTISTGTSMLRAGAAALCRRGGRSLLQHRTCPAVGPTVRSFADEAAQPSGSTSLDEQSVHIPITLHGTQGRYAKALYSAAVKEGKVEAIEEDLQKLYELARESDEFDTFVHDPSIPKAQRFEAIQALAKELGITEMTERFLEVLAENGRLPYLTDIEIAYDEILAAVRGEISVQITSAEPLMDEEVEDFTQGLQQLAKEGQELTINAKVDPSLMGGFILEVGDKRVDLSVKSRLKKVQQMIMETA